VGNLIHYLHFLIAIILIIIVILELFLYIDIAFGFLGASEIAGEVGSFLLAGEAGRLELGAVRTHIFDIDNLLQFLLLHGSLSHRLKIPPRFRPTLVGPIRVISNTFGAGLVERSFAECSTELRAFGFIAHVTQPLEQILHRPLLESFELFSLGPVDCRLGDCGSRWRWLWWWLLINFLCSSGFAFRCVK
jgi:hypothetical protein